MRRFLIPALLSSVACCVTPAFAADMPAPEYPAVIAPEVAYGGWYLRGDVGFTNQRVGTLDNAYWATTGSDFTVSDSTFSPSYFFGGGVGYAFSSWIRTDATLEYRVWSDFDGRDSYVNPAPFNGENFFDTSKSEIVGLLNAYVDIGTWGGLTPFVGAGIGFSHIMIGSLTDNGTFTSGGVTTTTAGTAPSKSQTNFAWALMAGVGYRVSPAVTLEASYRYLHLGDAKSGVIVDGVGAQFGQLEFNDLDSHDVRFGLRYAFGGAEAVTPPAEMIISK